MAQDEHPFSWKALGRILAVIIITLLAWKALDVFVNILIAITLATAIYPIVKTVNRKMPLLPAILLVLAALLIPFILLGVYVIPNLINQLPDLLNTLRPIINHLGFVPESLKNFDLAQYLSQHAGGLLASTKTVALTIVSIVEIVVLVFYFMLDHDSLLKLFLYLFPSGEQNKIKGMLVELATVNGQYIRGNVIISVICTAIIFIGFSILRIPFALPLAIIAGIMDLLPLVGSTLGAIPALIIGFSISPLTGVLVLALHLLYQQAENAIISPLIYNKALHLAPALSFTSVVIGGGLFGITGAFLALPIAASVPAMVRYARGYSERHHTV